MQKRTRRCASFAPVCCCIVGATGFSGRQKVLLARKPFASPGGLFDRTEGQWIVVDVDGTLQAARQRALPQTDALPPPHRRFDQVCAPGYQGRKRGEVVRARTIVLQAHTHQFWARLAGLATEIIETNCAGSSR